MTRRYDTPSATSSRASALSPNVKRSLRRLESAVAWLELARIRITDRHRGSGSGNATFYHPTRVPALGSLLIRTSKPKAEPMRHTTDILARAKHTERLTQAAEPRRAKTTPKRSNEIAIRSTLTARVKHAIARVRRQPEAPDSGPRAQTASNWGRDRPVNGNAALADFTTSSDLCNHNGRRQA